MLRWLSKSSGSVLECGSGVSTLVLAAALAPTARHLVSLENDAVWERQVRDALPVSLRAGLGIALAPLVNYGDFDWYDLHSAPPQDSIGFVVCDGPPGSTRGGRYGLTRVLGDRLTPGAIVLLDDTCRPDEREIIERWCAELPAYLIEDTPRHSVIQLSGVSS
jgi:predicted O-methyltransferase YrrM